MMKTVKTEEKQRPGIYLYQNDYELLCVLDPEERCKVLDAMMNYARSGELPDFSDSRLAMMAWKSIKPHLDHDAERYQKRIADGEYAVYCRECDRKELPRLSREEWEANRESLKNIDRYLPISTDNDRVPNRNTKSNTKTNSYSNTEGKTDRESERKEGNRKPSTAEIEQDFESKREAALKMLADHATTPV